MEEIILSVTCGRCGDAIEVLAADMVRALRALDRVVPICEPCVDLEEAAVLSGAMPKGSAVVRTNAGPNGDQWKVIRRAKNGG